MLFSSHLKTSPFGGISAFVAALVYKTPTSTDL